MELAMQYRQTISGRSYESSEEINPIEMTSGIECLSDHWSAVMIIPVRYKKPQDNGKYTYKISNLLIF